jgi:hypothetical protein
MPLSSLDFKSEIDEASKAYEMHVVCLKKLPEDLNLTSLVEKAVNAYNGRSEGFRHGIALNAYITVIISQSENQPKCGIYFNLHSPYLS